MNFKGFKKISQEADHSVLKHPQGHEIKVVHKALSKELKSQLDKLPHFSDGGMAKKEEADSGLIGSIKKAFSTPEPTPPPKQSPEEKYEAIRAQNRKNMGYAEGGSVPPRPPIDQDKARQVSDSFKKVFADGGPVGESGDQEMDPLEAQYAMENFNAKEAVKNSPQGQIESELQAEQAAPIAPAGNKVHEYLAEAIRNISSPSSPQSPQPDMQPMVNRIPQGIAPDAPKAEMQPQVPQQGLAPKPKGSLIDQYSQNIEQQSQADMAMAQNTAQSLDQQANIMGQEAQQMQDLRGRYEQAGQDIHNRIESLSEQVETGKIDPNQWWESKSTGSKILTAIGMMFAGAGMGAGGNPQGMSEIINKEIDRDIESQKANLNKKDNLLSKYMQLYKDLPQAEAAARLTLNAATEGMLKQQAAKLGSANAVLAVQNMVAERRKGMLPLMDDLAKGQAMVSAYQQSSTPQKSTGNGEQDFQNKMSQMKLIDPNGAKALEEKYLPGIGIAKIQVPEKVREGLVARKDLSTKLANLENFAVKHGGTVFDRSVVAEGKALAQDAKEALRIGLGMGALSGNEAKGLEKLIDEDPTKFLASIRTLPKYRTVRDANENTMKTMMKSYGIEGFKNSQETKTMNGKEYVKVPGGWKPK